jgi:serine/threonine-protein kinase RIO1
MGGSVSTTPLPLQDKKDGRNQSIEELSSVLMPIYYVEEPITTEEKEKAIRSWKLVASGQAAEFYRLKKADPVNIPCSSPMEFFGNRFIQRFFEVHPIAAPMFSKTSMKQGTLFFRMIAFTIAALDNDAKFDSQFVTLAKSHNRMGIRAVECK